MPVSSTRLASKERYTSAESAERKPKGIRSKEGCLTCRIRRKKCDQGKQADSCESCRRLHIECLGYSRNRPEWLKGAKVEVFKRMIKRFLAENSPKSGLHSRQDSTTVPVPFLSFESLRGHNDADPISMIGANSAQYGVGLPGPDDSMVLDKLEDGSEVSDDEEPRHYQLLPLAKKEVPPPFSPTGSTSGANQPKPDDPSMEIDELAEQPEPSSPSEAPVNVPAELAEEQHGEVAVAIDPAIMGPPAEDPDLVYYVNVVFPVLHELAGYNLSSHELLAFAHREGATRNVLIAQAKHHQNRMRFLTSTEDPHHPDTRQLCLELAATNNVCINTLAALGPSFEQATRRNDLNALAVLYTLLHFGGLGDLIARHQPRRGSLGIASGTSSLLDLSSRWLANTIGDSSSLASALRRGGDRHRALIQTAIHIDIFSSISYGRPPSLLDAYRTSFKHADASLSKDSNGVRVAVEPRLDDLLDIPAKTLLALAETAAMSSWKTEHVRQGSLSVMDLSRWAKRIDALLAPPSAESLLPFAPAVASTTARAGLVPPPRTQLLPVVASVASAASPVVPGATAKGTKPTSATLDAAPVVAQSSDRRLASPTPADSPVQVPKLEVPGVHAVDSITTSSPTNAQVPHPSPTSTVAKDEPSSSDDVALPATTAPPTIQAPPGTTEPAAPSATPDTTDKPLGHVVAPAAPRAPYMQPSASPAPPPADIHVRPVYRRTLPPSTREVFRCAGRVFLHTVLSGERPRVHDIAQAVLDTCNALRDLGLSYLPPTAKPQPADDLRFPVVRGLPFCIFIAGSVAGSMEQGMFLRSCLRPVVREVDMQTAELLTAVLGERAGSGDAVSWQAVMAKRGTRLVFM